MEPKVLKDGTDKGWYAIWTAGMSYVVSGYKITSKSSSKIILTENVGLPCRAAHLKFVSQDSLSFK